MFAYSDYEAQGLITSASTQHLHCSSADGGLVDTVGTVCQLTESHPFYTPFFSITGVGWALAVLLSTNNETSRSE